MAFLAGETFVVTQDLGWGSLERQQRGGISFYSLFMFSLKTTDFDIPQHRLFISMVPSSGY